MYYHPSVCPPWPKPIGVNNRSTSSVSDTKTDQPEGLDKHRLAGPKEERRQSSTGNTQGESIMLKKISGVVVAISPLSAFAALPPGVQDAIDTGTADGKTIAYALLVFAVTIGVIMYLKRRAG